MSMAIKAGKVLRTATAAARKFQRKQFSATAEVSPSSGVGTFLGIPKLPRSETDLLISNFNRLYQNRVTKKGAFTEEKLKKMLSGGDRVGINETMMILEGKSVAETNNLRSTVKSKSTK